ncbi:MAG TPA: hypothetical protein VJZ71_20110 [Phycisphaerae bacterium]|nr:hypothetical protein [Phycisphaerae bacterium]
MNLQQANFEDLQAKYYFGTEAHVAAKYLVDLIRRKKGSQLATLLRDYRQQPIVAAREIELRAATDRLLNCYSAMEVASLIRFIPKLDEADFGTEARLILGNKLVRRYYEDFYPTKLPQLFRCRIDGAARDLQEHESNDANGCFLTFLDLDRRFMEKLEDGYFLRMLDSFVIEGYWFDDVVTLIEAPEEFICHLLLPPSERDARSCAIHEFSLFMQFCFDLRLLLAQVESQPLLQSAMWHHYSYWFDIIGDQLRERLGEALSRFLKWEPTGNKEEAVGTVQTYVLEARNVLTFLTSRKCAAPVETLLKNVSRSEGGRNSGKRSRPDGIVTAMNALQARFQVQTSLYGNVSGDDAKRIYSDSMATVLALASSLETLSVEVHSLVQRRKRRIDEAIESTARLLDQAEQQVVNANKTSDPTEAEAYVVGSDLSKAVAKSTFRAGQLTYASTRFVLLTADITGWAAVAALGASDEHYQKKAVQRFLQLVGGFLSDALEPFEGANKAWECLVAIRDILKARVDDMRAADDVITRERNYQTLVTLAGLQAERTALAIKEMLLASDEMHSPREVSWDLARLTWRERLDAANKTLGR